MNTRKTLGIAIGLLLFAVVLLLPAPEGMSHPAKKAAAVTILMAVWWMTEAIPISATGLVPLALFPLLGILDAKSTTVNYGNSIILLLLGGFFVAKAIELHNLHRRIALLIISRMGTDKRLILLSVILATAGISMWIANITVALLMLPIGIAIASLEGDAGDGDRRSKFGVALMLAIAYSATIGGLGTLVGTTSNMIFAGMTKSLYPEAPEFGFLQWLLIGFPLVVILVPAMWVYMVWFFDIKGSLPGSKEMIRQELHSLGPMSKPERRVLAIFVLTALGWVFREDIAINAFTIPGWSSLIGIQHYADDATVAIAGALLMFCIPTGIKLPEGKKGPAFLLDWEAARTVPWGVMVLVGGGYAIAAGFTSTGLVEWIGRELAFMVTLPTPVVLLAIVVCISLFTEVCSNTATANIFLPILATMAVAGNFHPYLLMIPGTIASSFAFMLPSGTGPNAVVFGSGRVTIPEMAWCGVWLKVISIVLVTLLMYLIAAPVFGAYGGLPEWAR